MHGEGGRLHSHQIPPFFTSNIIHFGYFHYLYIYFFFSSCLLFLSKIEGDLDRTIIDRMNEYGSVDDVKKSFDRLQQRVRFSP